MRHDIYLSGRLHKLTDVETFGWSHGHDGENAGLKGWALGDLEGREEEQGHEGRGAKGRVEEVWLSGYLDLVCAISVHHVPITVGVVSQMSPPRERSRRRLVMERKAQGPG